MKTNNTEIKNKLAQFTAGVWRVIGRQNLYVVRNEVGCDNGQSIYQVFVRHSDPWNPANNVSEHDSLNEAVQSL